jgi:phosphopantetheinyl transferase (holo-ACP synthase)
VLLHGSAHALLGSRKVDLSLSHAATHAIAVVLIED